MFPGIRLVFTAVFLPVLACSYGCPAKVGSFRELSQTVANAVKVNLPICDIACNNTGIFFKDPETLPACVKIVSEKTFREWKQGADR